MSEDSFDHWAIVELMGHVRIAGRLTEVELFGAKMGRLDVPKDDGFFTQYFGGSSVYRITPTTEEVARRIAEVNTPQPVYPYELSRPALPAGTADDDGVDDWNEG